MVDDGKRRGESRGRDGGGARGEAGNRGERGRGRGRDGDNHRDNRRDDRRDDRRGPRNDDRRGPRNDDRRGDARSGDRRSDDRRDDRRDGGHGGGRSDARHGSGHGGGRDDRHGGGYGGGHGSKSPRDRREGPGHFRRPDGREPGRRDPNRPGGPRRPVSVSVRGGGRGERRGGQEKQHWIFGRHAVQAALANPARSIERLVATESAAAEAGIAEHPLLEKAGRADMDHMLSRYEASAVSHGGVAAYAAALPPASFEAALKPEGRALCILLDQVSDPQNTGAIMRTAAAFGARAVIAPERHSAPVTGSMAKAASGALESLPYLRPTNLARAMAMLKEWGYWRIGLDAAAGETLDAAAGFDRVALVLGSEGKGLRRLTAENCDLLVGIPMAGEMASLNVSNAAAIAVHRLFAS